MRPIVAPSRSPCEPDRARAHRPAARGRSIDNRLTRCRASANTPFGYSSRPAARRDDDRNASWRCCREIDEVDTDTGACEDTQPWGAREKTGIDDDVSTDDRPHGIGDVVRAWFGDERNFLAEDPSDQRRIDRAKCHDNRTVDSHDVTHSP